MFLVFFLTFVGNMIHSVVLDGNPLNEDEDMIMLTCVVLDDNPLDRVFSLNGNPLDEDDGYLLDEVVLDRICLDGPIK